MYTIAHACLYNSSVKVAKIKIIIIIKLLSTGETYTIDNKLQYRTNTDVTIIGSHSDVTETYAAPPIKQ